ncbi:MAG: hypothetical protein K2Y05_00415 [Hyphomicrobiaceae bacterium]|nr:hypothetical protein [Hyphomicrobiaceae bacterium]
MRIDTVNAGTKSGQITFTTSDTDENPFNYSVAGRVLMVIGSASNDVLDNGDTALAMTGASGDDDYIVNLASDAVVEQSSEGNDRVLSSVSYTLPQHVERLQLTGSDPIRGTGNALNNSLVGNASNNILAGRGGNDTLDGGDGTDTVDYSLALGPVSVNLTLGTASNDGDGGIDTLFSIESIFGSSFDDVLNGNSTANVFDGGGGVDRFIGGNGNDSYTVDAQSDLVFETLGEGTDAIVSSASFYLYANVENLTLTGTASFGVGNNLANALVGNAEQNLLIGGDGNDTIDGGAARDTIYGAEGSDTLYGQAGIDYIVAGNGNDTIYGGNDADEVHGQDGNDLIYGGDDFSTDILVGGAGNDTIDGGAAWDQMYGGTGDDTYYVSQQVDWVFEGVGEGTDNVIVDSPNGHYLYANIENMTLVGNTSFGVGNDLHNGITGNAIANVLLGGLGNDQINGKAGNDVLWGEAGSDTYVFERGTGVDAIGGFVAGADKIELSGLGYSSYAQIQPLIFQSGTNTGINLGLGDVVVLVNISAATLSSTDFLFS